MRFPEHRCSRSARGAAHALRMAAWALLAPAAGGIALAQDAASGDSPRDFAVRAAITADGGAALYRLALTRDVYRGVADPALADLRVFNGAAEALPFALVPRPPAVPMAAPNVALKVFAIPVTVADGPATGGGGVHIETSGAGSVVRIDVAPGSRLAGVRSAPGGYLIDASQARVALHAMTLDIAASADYAGRARLEASDDLASWHEISSDVPLLSVTHGPERLERRRIEFAPQKAAYYRLFWSAMPADARLAGVQAQAGEIPAEAEHEWESLAPLAPQAAAATSADAPIEYRFDSAAHLPADRLRLELPEANTVASLQVFSREHRDDPWRAVARATVYRLNRAGGQITSPPIAIGTDTDRYWLLRVDRRGGGLGAGEPHLLLGWVPQQIVFAARGSPPYELAFGWRKAAAVPASMARPGAVAIDALIPGYGAAATAGAGASATALEPAPATLGALSAPAAQPAGERSSGIATRTLLLWAILGAGVALLAAMAWHLLRQLGHAPPASGPE